VKRNGTGNTRTGKGLTREDWRCEHPLNPTLLRQNDIYVSTKLKAADENAGLAMVNIEFRLEPAISFERILIWRYSIKAEVQGNT
jgi:hypothetical protein